MSGRKVLDSKPWRKEVSDEQVEAWLVKLQSIKTEFQLEEVLHYVTLEQVQQGYVPSQPEYEYLTRQYQPTSSTSQPIQTPEKTFGEKIVNRPCPRCHSTETGFLAAQLRSADEPTSYLFKCETCGYNWKYR